MNNFFVSVFISKSGKKCYALCMNQFYLTFDRELILEALDIRPKELEKLDVGQYPIN